MPKMPKVQQALIAFDSELRTGAQQRAPTNSELFWTRMKADKHGQVIEKISTNEKGNPARQHSMPAS